MRYDPGDMLIFARVAEARSMSAAAKTLMKSKASVSRAIARLEAALNARLLERSSRHVSLTEAGRTFLVHCRRVAEEIEAAEAAVGELQATIRGHLRVAVPLVFGRSVLAPMLSEFMEKYPELSMELQVTNRTVDPIEEGFDLVVRAGPLPDSTLLVRELGRAQYGAFASPRYLQNHPDVESPADLAGHRVLDIFDGSSQIAWGFMRDQEAVTVAVRPRMDINDAVIRRDAAIGGLGIALVPEWMCRAAVDAGLLRQVCPQWRSTRVNAVSALWPSRRNPSPRLRAFLDFLTAGVTREFACGFGAAGAA